MTQNMIPGDSHWSHLAAGQGFTSGPQWSNLKLIMEPTSICAQKLSKLEKYTSSTSLLVMIFHQTAMRIVSHTIVNRSCNVFVIEIFRKNQQHKFDLDYI